MKARNRCLIKGGTARQKEAMTFQRRTSNFTSRRVVVHPVFNGPSVSRFGKEGSYA